MGGGDSNFVSNGVCVYTMRCWFEEKKESGENEGCGSGASLRAVSTRVWVCMCGYV